MFKNLGIKNVEVTLSYSIIMLIKKTISMWVSTVDKKNYHIITSRYNVDQNKFL